MRSRPHTEVPQPEKTGKANEEIQIQKRKLKQAMAEGLMCFFRTIPGRNSPPKQKILKELDVPVLQLQQKYFRRLTSHETLAFNQLCEKLRRKEKG